MRKLLVILSCVFVFASCALSNPYVSRLSQIKNALSKQDYTTFAKNIRLFEITDTVSEDNHSIAINYPIEFFDPLASKAADYVTELRSYFDNSDHPLTADDFDLTRIKSTTTSVNKDIVKVTFIWKNPLKMDVDNDMYFVRDKNGDVFPIIIDLEVTKDDSNTWSLKNLIFPTNTMEEATLLPSETLFGLGRYYYYLATNGKAYGVPKDRLKAFDMRTFFEVDSGSVTDKLKDLVK